MNHNTMHTLLQLLLCRFFRFLSTHNGSFCTKQGRELREKAEGGIKKENELYTVGNLYQMDFQRESIPNEHYQELKEYVFSCPFRILFVSRVHLEDSGKEIAIIRKLCIKRDQYGFGLLVWLSQIDLYKIIRMSFRNPIVIIQLKAMVWQLVMIPLSLVIQNNTD